MDGRKIYEYALKNVPLVIQQTLDKSGTDVRDVKKVLVHQANGKMDEAILKRLFKLNGITDTPMNVMPMTIANFGNSSVATVPTLLDLILKKILPIKTAITKLVNMFQLVLMRLQQLFQELMLRSVLILKLIQDQFY
jgi:3-oxoacyl-[acyl-carrier-protein] synthase-3